MTPEQKVCADAADLIERCGWAQGCFHAQDGYCIAGALMECAGGINGYTWAREFISAETGIPLPLSHWNDDPARTKSEVIAALRKAAGEGR